LTTIARRLVVLPDVTFKPTSDCNQIRNGRLALTANRHLDLSAPLCVGCFRTLDEIAGWRDFSDAQRQAVFEKLPER
jgi:hypothetical protein